jgi:methanogenic corrinoid protein MtbC1
VSRLRRLRQATEKGHSIGQVARLSEGELDRLLGEWRERSDAPDPYGALRERFLQAISKLDVIAADLELSRAATLFPARSLIKKVVAPILDEVGRLWAHKEMGVAHEHVATGLLRNLLSALFRLYPPKDYAETIVLATPAGERHEFGILQAALLAATRGWRVVYLGTDLPAAEIAHTVRLTGSRYLGLSVVTSENSETGKELSELSKLLPAETRVWVGGEDAARHRALIENANWILVPDLDDFDDRLNR